MKLKEKLGFYLYEVICDEQELISTSEEIFKEEKFLTQYDSIKGDDDNEHDKKLMSSKEGDDNENGKILMSLNEDNQNDKTLMSSKDGNGETLNQNNNNIK